MSDSWVQIQPGTERTSCIPWRDQPSSQKWRGNELHLAYLETPCPKGHGLCRGKTSSLFPFPHTWWGGESHPFPQTGPYMGWTMVWWQTHVEKTAIKGNKGVGVVVLSVCRFALRLLLRRKVEYITESVQNIETIWFLPFWPCGFLLCGQRERLR